ncbi:DUF5675 family protein [Persicitalea jodogahamensis]|uniref:DUF5675 domain-containing protein n=1 Tax=Persicitalea jodogahamensis TaxID=402147 RepID=A0A8J3G9K6_9BACT|nr:DUF5675 family protein [Persicitalea jodogahamensis]GHB64281.1 hypothetical protein GCM10007390_17710 [Persicitalea jodogahamensis]
MEILQKRVKRGKNSTLSILYVNGKKHGFVVEDKDRDLHSGMTLAELIAIKVHSETAIPTGRYQVGKRYSPKFKRWLPWLLDVLGFQFIYCHPGNWIKDTQGCLLPGLSWGYESGEYCVRQSRACFEPLWKEIEAALGAGEEVWWTIVAVYEDGAGRLLV